MQVTYEEMTQWRDLCEFLNAQWYKCAEADDFERTLKHCKVWRNQEHRQKLWDAWELQIIQWCGHPAADYSYCRDYRKWKGWRLAPDWEVKIDFLEKVAIFDADPETLDQPWRITLARAREEKRQREEEQRQRDEQRQREWQRQQDEWRRQREWFDSLTPEEKAAERQRKLDERNQQLLAERIDRIKRNLCSCCGSPRIPLMVDCLKCGESYCDSGEAAENAG
ncbi:MAG TPA: hypothetical protein V6D12_13590 [Candidatus Obscuribacterales bacterium]